MNKPWKLILLLTGIFLTGALTGGIVTQRVFRKQIAKRLAPEFWCPNRLEMLTKKLALSSEQQEKLKPIVQRDMDELIKVRDTHIADIRRIIDRMDRDMGEVLTPEQKAKFNEINRDRRRRANRLVETLTEPTNDCLVETAPGKDPKAALAGSAAPVESTVN